MAQTSGQQTGTHRTASGGLQETGTPELGAPAQGTGGQMMGHQSGGRLPTQTRDALATVAQAVGICAWCAEQCIEEANPHMIECIRLCEDVTELGETVLAMAPRNSRHTDHVVQAFQQAAQACARECGQHQDPHCQECAQFLPQAASAVQQLGQTTQQTPMQ